MEKNVLILRDKDVYTLGVYSQEQIRGGNDKMYKAHIAIRVYNDGKYKVLKDRYNTSDREIQRLINPVKINTSLLLVL